MASDPAWQVRAGAARAPAAAGAAVAVPALTKSLGDPNTDVRKAAVLVLTRHAGAEEAHADADVRAYAVRGL